MLEMKRTTFFLFLVLIFLPSNSFAWLSGWEYRKEIVIDNTANSNSLIDYQVNLKLRYYPNMSADFSDIRFTYFNYTTNEEITLPYWIENIENFTLNIFNLTNMEEVTVYGTLNNNLIWANNRGSGNIGYIHVTNLSTLETRSIAIPNGAFWQAVFDGENVYIVGQGLENLHSILISFNLKEFPKHNLTYRADTADANELIGIYQNDTHIIAGERVKGGNKKGSKYPNGGGLWVIPKESIADNATWRRIYEDSDQFEWISIAYSPRFKKWYAYLSDVKSGAYKIISSNDLKNWKVEIKEKGKGVNVKGMLRIINGYPFVVTVNFTTDSIHLLIFNESWKEYNLGIKINKGSQSVKIIDLKNDKILLIHSYIENSKRGMQELYYVYPYNKIEFLARYPGILIHLSPNNYTFGDMLYLPSSFINARLSSIYTLSQEKHAKVWIKVPYIPAGSNTTIYLYYGNLTPVTSASDSKSVFEDFDDFSKNTLHSYIQIDEGWDINVTSGYLISPSSGRGFLFKPKSISRNYTLRVKMYFNNSDVGVGFIGSKEKDKKIIGYLANYYPHPPAHFKILNFPDKIILLLFSRMRLYFFDDVCILSFLPSVSSGWYILEMRTNSTHIEVVRDSLTDCVIKDNSIETFEGIVFRQKSRKSIAADWWLLRKFSYPEPIAKIRE